jgi:hypothetical protein
MSASAASNAREVPILLTELLGSPFWRCVSLQEDSFRRSSSQLVSLERCGVYDEEGYSTMTHDRPRNSVYSEAIRRASVSGCKSFLEIGCGADACLTRMVLSQKGTSIFALEANHSSAKAAAAVLADNFDSFRFSIVPKLSTSSELKDFYAALRDGGVDVVLQEVLGYIASREGIVPIFRHLQKNLDFSQTGCIAIPSHCATFYTPTYVTMKDLRHNLRHRGSLLAAKGGLRLKTASGVSSTSAAFILVSRLQLSDTASFGLGEITDGAGMAQGEAGTGGAAGRRPRCGALEFLSLCEDLGSQLMQVRTVTFTAPPAGAIVNSLSCFVWAACAPVSQSGSASSSSPPTTPPRGTRSKDSQGGGTDYPYGVEDLPVLPMKTLSFSAATTDSVVATNWPVLVVLLERELRLSPGSQLQVESTANLRMAPHIYQWRYRLRDAATVNLNNKRKRDLSDWGPWSDFFTLDSSDSSYRVVESAP